MRAAAILIYGFCLLLISLTRWGLKFVFALACLCAPWLLAELLCRATGY